MKTLQYLFTFILSLSLFACMDDPSGDNSPLEGVTEHGYYYKILRNVKSPLAKPNDIVFFNVDLYEGGILQRRSRDMGRTMKKLMVSKDSFQRESQTRQLDHFFAVSETLYHLSKGDSAFIKTGMYQSSDTLKQKEITFIISIADIKSKEEVMLMEEKLLEKRRKDREKNEASLLGVSTNFGLYLKDIEEGNKVSSTYMTKSGIKVVILQQGQGQKPVPGDKVQFHFYAHHTAKGMIDETYSSNKPEEVVLGAFILNIGLEEGLLMMPRGSKAMLYIPAKIANISSKIKSAIPEGTDLNVFVDLLDEPIDELY